MLISACETLCKVYDPAGTVEIARALGGGFAGAVKCAAVQ